MVLANMRRRGAIILAIVLSGTFAALVAALAWSAIAALSIYAGSMAAATALLLWSIYRTPDHGPEREGGEDDRSD